MGVVLRFVTHGRASLASLIPKTAGSASISSFPSASESARKYSAGMEPRPFQLLTTGVRKPSKLATAEVSPKASMTASAELSMPLFSSRNVKMSRGHALAIDFTRSERFNASMRSRDDIADRLRRTQKALGLSNVDLCAIIECAENRWSQYTGAKSSRKITDEIANRLCDHFGLTLDWIYRGDPKALPHELRMKLARQAA